ncbi:MAG TPA: hypothetical protein VFN35_18760 [Ktedonobacteraceae bacterium]|nr:hypothetical protein [Ktedonobacteraceae bacterium]
METTCTLEFTLAARQYLGDLEHELKQIHGIQVLLVLPKDDTAPALISLGIGRGGEHAELAIRRITHILYDFLHGVASEPARRIILVTNDGESTDITSLSSDDIKQVLGQAYASQNA